LDDRASATEGGVGVPAIKTLGVFLFLSPQSLEQYVRNLHES